MIRAALARSRGGGGWGFVVTSVGLIGGKAVSLAVGFLFWLLAARAADVQDVGLAAGAVSLMMLATQLAVAGAGSSFILHRTTYADRLPRLLDTAVTVVLLASTVGALAALGVVVLALEELRPVATDPTFALLFVLMTAFGTLGILLDHVSVALASGRQVLVRNTVGGLLTAAPLLLTPAFGWRFEAELLFGLWVLGGATACALAGVQLSRQLEGYRYRPRLSRPLVVVLLRTGLPNHALTLVERAPNLLLPVVVTEVLSPEANAYWYMAWMMAWAVLVIPVSIGITLLAQVTRGLGALRPDVVRAGLTGVALGLPAAAVLAAVAGPVLALLGSDFRAEATSPLRVLLLALPPVMVLQLYYSVCRTTRRLPEALATGAVLGSTAVLGTAAVGAGSGLVGMAWVWVAVQGLAGLWAAARLARLVAGARAVQAPDAQPALPAHGRVTVPTSPGQARDGYARIGS